MPINTTNGPRPVTPGNVGTGPVSTPATPAAAPVATPIPLAQPKSPDDVKRDEVKKAAAGKLIGTAIKLKDVTGTGQESAAKGDPRINERRSVLSTLISAKTDQMGMTFLEAISPQVAQDIKWLKAADRSDYKLDGTRQFDWAQSDMTTGSTIEAEFRKRVEGGKKQAEGLDTGTRKFLDASDHSVIGAALVKDPAKRAAALTDVLLQFRARQDVANTTAVTHNNVYGQNEKRIDKIGPALVAEQRVLLASAQLDSNDPQKVKEYALLREVIASHPLSSVNGIFEARNAIGKLFMDGKDNYSSTTHETAWVKTEIPPGATASPYTSIHHNFSRDTPKNIAAWISANVFTRGPESERGPLFLKLTGALKQAREGDVAGAKAALKAAQDGVNQDTLKPLLDGLAAAPNDAVADTILTFLKESANKPLGADPEANLGHAATVYRSVCADQPGAATLEARLFKAGDAWPEVADVIAQLRGTDSLGLLKDLGEARLAIRDEVVSAKTGYERHDLIQMDAQLNRITCETLGASVDRVGTLKTDPQKAECLLAVQTALRSAVASGLHELKDPADPAAQKGRGLPAVLKDVDAALAEGKIDPQRYRDLMSETRLEVTRTVQNIRSFVDVRAAEVALGGQTLDPEFLDQFVKQGPLHYATALSEKGMRAGLVEEITPRSIKNVEGMRVLNSVGPVVFGSVVFGENTKDLVKLKPPKDALSIVYHLEEKKMVAVGGLVVDTAHAPGGNSHLNMYAMNNGIPVLALPELRTKYAEFFANAQNEGGIYVDDSNGQFQMMTVKLAREQGLLDDQKIKDLRPGTNRNIAFIKPNTAQDGFEVLARHSAMVSPNRKTREIELYVPVDEVRGLGKECVSFEQLGTLGIHARHLAGEKGTVLALLRTNPALAKYVPDGSVVTTGRVNGMLKEAGLYDQWNAVWTQDPKVGLVDDSNFLQSAFYTDADYRAKTRETLQKDTREKLLAHFIAKDANGVEVLSPAGQKLYDELMKNPAMANSDAWIMRSSFTGEDRPGKSGAGQYESYRDIEFMKADKVPQGFGEVTTSLPVARIKGVIGVVESTWMPEPVENNVSDQINLQHIAPSVVVQHCLKPQESGVMVSRNTEHGTRNQVTYQLVKGFGGGVDGGKAEEGVITANGVQMKVKYPDTVAGLVGDAALRELRTLVLGTEQFFQDVVEAGKGHAVDMEVARENGEWKIVQARTIAVDK
jgi:hypothetical protein